MSGWRDDVTEDVGDRDDATGTVDEPEGVTGPDDDSGGQDDGPPVDGALDGQFGDDEIVVLHVDDDEAVLDLTAEFLERVADDFDVRRAVGARAGLDVLETASVDCVISDYQMPAMDGLEFLERVRDTHPDVPFVLFTGEGSESVASDALAAGVTDYVPKGGGRECYEVLANRVRNAVNAERAKRTVERAARRFRRITDNAPVPIGIVDEEYRIRYVNDASVEFFGAADERELRGESALEFVHPADRERAGNRIRTVLQEHEFPAPVETRFVTDDGSKYGVVTSAPVEYRGEPAAQVVLDDVTAERTGGGDVVHRDAFTESLLQSLQGVFFVFEVGSGLVEWNDRVEAVTGYDAETLAGAPPTLFLPEPDRDHVVTDVATIRDDGAVRYDGEFETADGERVPYEIHVASHEAPDGRLFGVGFGHTEGVEREARVRERKEQLETVLENFPVVAFTVDPGGVFTNSAGSGLEGLGVEPGELVGQSLYELYGEYDAILDSFDRALSGESAESTVTIDGVTFETRYEPVFDGDAVTQVVGVAFDVSDRVAQREALEAKNERLEEFASVLSHDLRNPLSVAAGTLDVLEPHVDDDGHEHVRTVRVALNRMTGIVEDVLALARGGSGTVETNPVSGAQVAALAVENVDTTNVDVDVEYDAVLDANEESLARLVENLVRNAVEHGGDCVVVGSLADDPGFYVADDGPGLPADVDGSLFEAGVSTDDRGTGLGLAIVADIADAHDWTVETDTDPDLGGARIEVRDVDRA
jgi:PAS domain S-box-containing protein